MCSSIVSYYIVVFVKNWIYPISKIAQKSCVFSEYSIYLTYWMLHKSSSKQFMTHPYQAVMQRAIKYTWESRMCHFYTIGVFFCASRKTINLKLETNQKLVPFAGVISLAPTPLRSISFLWGLFLPNHFVARESGPQGNGSKTNDAAKETLEMSEKYFKLKSTLQIENYS